LRYSRLSGAPGVAQRVHITDQFARREAPAERYAPIFMDAEVIGFGIQVRPSGRRSSSKTMQPGSYRLMV
jgi:hypothetical protein